MEPGGSPKIRPRRIPRALAATVLSISMSPIVVALLEIGRREVSPIEEWLSVVAVGTAVFGWLGRLGTRVNGAAAIACVLIFPLRGFYVDIVVLAPSACEDIDALWAAPSRPLATPYVYLFAVVYFASAAAYFVCRHVRTREASRLVSSAAAGVLLIGFVVAGLTVIQLGGFFIVTVAAPTVAFQVALIAPIAYGLMWCPVVLAIVLGREVALAVRAAIVRRLAWRFVWRASAVSLTVATACAALPAIAAGDATAAWRVFSRTSGWVFSRIDRPYCRDIGSQ
jgi:hypothetical protein